MAEIKKNRGVQRLVIEVLSKDKRRDIVTFKVVAQTLRGADFGDENPKDPANAGMFKSGVFKLMSVGCPELKMPAKTLYVRGAKTEKDDTIISCDHTSFDIVAKAVRAFNKKFKGSPEPVIDRFATADEAA